MGADPNCLKINAGKRVVQQTVIRAPDGGLLNAFVNVKGSFPQAAVPPASAVIDQQGCVYHPRVQGVRVGQTLEVKNSDATLHNIHSMSTKGSDFNVGQPLAGMVYKYQLKADEVMLHVKCDVHSWMTGYIGVVPHPYFAVTDAAGAFTIANVPSGKQALQVWHEQYGALTQTVDVKAGGTTTVEFAYTGNEKPSQTALAVQELVVPADAAAVQLIAPSRPD
jgi:plastocyanin